MKTPAQTLMIAIQVREPVTSGSENERQVVQMLRKMADRLEAGIPKFMAAEGQECGPYDVEGGYEWIKGPR